MSRRLAPENFVAEKLAWHQRIASDPKISLQAKAVAGFILHDLSPCEGGAWRGQESMPRAWASAPAMAFVDGVTRKKEWRSRPENPGVFKRLLKSIGL